MTPEIHKLLKRSLKSLKRDLITMFTTGQIGNERVYTKSVKRIDDMLEDLNSINK